MENENTDWLQDLIERRDGYDTEAVRRFSERLLRLAGSRMPDQLQRRLDPEDIVQSVFRSFFTRHAAGKFEFNEAADLWRLLAAITFHKVQKKIRHHFSLKRDVNREVDNDLPALPVRAIEPTASSVVTMTELLDQILAELPETHREIVRLRLDNYSMNEIAEQVDVSTRTVLRAMNLVREVAGELGNRP